MLQVREYTARFGKILDDLDALAAACGGGDAEALEDLNAELEDALLLLGQLDPAQADGQEEFGDTLDALCALAGDYRSLGGRVPGLAALAGRLDAAAEAARSACGG